MQLKWPSFVCLCVCSHRIGVWFSDAKASVHMWRQQQSPRACWKDTKHLVPTTGERPEGPVWGTAANHKCAFTDLTGAGEFCFLHLKLSFKYSALLGYNWIGKISTLLTKAQQTAPKELFFDFIMLSGTENKRLILCYCYVHVKPE